LKRIKAKVSLIVKTLKAISTTSSDEFIRSFPSATCAEIYVDGQARHHLTNLKSLLETTLEVSTG
jgi:hypothetical protein